MRGPALVHGTALLRLPVVSIDSGEALADVRDVLYDAVAGALLGFTLNKRGGLFAGQLKRPLPLSSVAAVGRDAVMVADAGALDGEAGAAAAAAAHARSRNVLGNEVVTDAGEPLGRVTDLVVAIGIVGSTTPDGHRVGDVVGYEFAAGPPPERGGKDQRNHPRRLLPLPDTLAVSGTHLVVPAGVEPYIRDDLSGFGPAVRAYRTGLAGTDPATEADR